MALLEQVYRGLRGLGFKEGEARRALDKATEELSKVANPSAQDLLRAALHRLGPRGASR
jgi:Holliday junction resolvasome RuvABC DNA-binding subunit